MWLVFRVLGALWAMGVALKLGAPGLVALLPAVLVLGGHRWVRPALQVARVWR